MKLKLKITKIAARTCAGYGSNKNCLAATAAKRQFETGNVQARGSSITIDGKLFWFSWSDGDKLFNAYGPYFMRRIVRADFEPFVISLTPYEKPIR